MLLAASALLHARRPEEESPQPPQRAASQCTQRCDEGATAHAAGACSLLFESPSCPFLEAANFNCRSRAAFTWSRLRSPTVSWFLHVKTEQSSKGVHNDSGRLILTCGLRQVNRRTRMSPHTRTDADVLRASMPPFAWHSAMTVLRLYGTRHGAVMIPPKNLPRCKASL